jgi:hypothetical protein
MGRKNRSTLVPVREPNGRLQRPTAAAIGAVSPAEARRLRDAALRGMRDAEWGTELGRLFLADEIESAEFEAGKRWGRLVAAYYQAIGAKPPHPKGMTFDRTDPSPEPDADSEPGQRRLKRDRAVIEDMREAHAVLIGAGLLAERAVRGICEASDTSPHLLGLHNLRRGLQWLARHWQLVHAPKKKTA